MNERYSNLEETIQSYVFGRLSAQENEEFEEFYLSNPELIDKIEVAQRIYFTSFDLSEFESVTATLESNKKDSLIKRLIGWISVPIPAYASLALIVGAISFQVINPIVQSGSESIELVGFSTTETRGTQLDSEIDLSQVNGHAAVMIKLKDVDHQYYVLDVTSPDNRQLWQSAPFQVGPLKDRLILLPSKLQEETVKIKVSGLNMDGLGTAVEFCHYSEICR